MNTIKDPAAVERFAMAALPLAQNWNPGTPVCTGAAFAGLLKALGKNVINPALADLLYFLAATPTDKKEQADRREAIYNARIRAEGAETSLELTSAIMADHNTQSAAPPGTLKQAAVDALRRLCPAETGSGQGLNLIRASDIPYEPPRWTISPYFQRGKGTLIQGDNGAGKTAFMCAVAAHITTGRPLLDSEISTPGTVLMLSVEDDLPVLRGRIEADGGDLEKVVFMANTAGMTFASPVIEEAIKQTHAVMVIFDPLQAFLGAKVDMFRANETRPQLAKLFEVCEREDCACAIVAHLAKGAADKSPVNRALGSVDIPAAMRSILHLIRNPDNPDECVMVQVKCSNAPKGRSIAYTIGDRGGVQWEGYSDMTPDDLTRVAKRKESGIPYDQEPLVQVFNQLITDKPGGGFWSYSELKAAGAKILGFPPYGDLNELRQKLDSGLAKELQKRDGLLVVHGVTGRARSHGIRIERYQVPQGYQTKMDP